eukprot:4110720-Pyramimonas_sp.AAC.2
MATYLCAVGHHDHLDDEVREVGEHEEHLQVEAVPTFQPVRLARHRAPGGAAAAGGVVFKLAPTAWVVVMHHGRAGSGAGVGRRQRVLVPRIAIAVAVAAGAGSVQHHDVSYASPRAFTSTFRQPEGYRTLL